MAHDDGTASITVNGEHRRVREGITIAQLAADLGLEPTKVAVERNFEVVPRSTLGEDLHVEVCSSCHPFYTGKLKIVDSGGRVDKFRKRYSKAAS